MSLDARRRQNRLSEAEFSRRLQEESDRADLREWERGQQIIAEEAARVAALSPEDRAAEEAEEAVVFAAWDRERRRIADAEAGRRADAYLTSGT
jgi:hypothetical protein